MVRRVNLPQNGTEALYREREGKLLIELELHSIMQIFNSFDPAPFHEKELDREAEEYMEARRRFMWENGYQLRRLNQAYFAFHGAYADITAGAAGSDPVGPAVVSLRNKSQSLADFINTISWMSSFDQLQQAIQVN